MTHQQGPSGGVRILKNWKAGNNTMTGSKGARTGNGGIKSGGGVMNDQEFTEFWIKESMRREASLNRITGTAGGSSSVTISRLDEPIPTVEVAKLPTSLANFRDVTKPNPVQEHSAFKATERNQSFNIAGTRI
jgi:hypothetical protein